LSGFVGLDTETKEILHSHHPTPLHPPQRSRAATWRRSHDTPASLRVHARYGDSDKRFFLQAGSDSWRGRSARCSQVRQRGGAASAAKPSCASACEGSSDSAA
jgi:hypothetical protein